jgi:hypothetical protein
MSAFRYTRYTRLKSIEQIENMVFNVGIDKKGKIKGYQVISSKVEMAESDPRANYGYTREPGIWYVAGFTSLRDGKDYGQITKIAWARTKEELDIMIEKRVQGARKSKS